MAKWWPKGQVGFGPYTGPKPITASGRTASSMPNVQNLPSESSINARLRARGLMPLRWGGTRERLTAVGVEIELHPEALASATRSGGQAVPGTDMTNTHWAAAWAVCIAEAEPCSEDARDWALEKAARDEDFRGAIDTIVRLGGTATARGSVADFVMEMWTPEAP